MPMNAEVEQWTDGKVTAEMMMSLAELIYRTGCKEYQQYVELMHQQPVPQMEITIPNCYMLAWSLYSAETFRLVLVYDEKEADFMRWNRRIRNGCYEIYWQARMATIRAQLADRNDFIREPLEIEIIRGIYPQESECVKTFTDTEEHAFVRQTMEYFMLYLTDYIGRKYPGEIAWVQARKAAQEQPKEEPKKEERRMPDEGDYVGLAAWLEDEKKAGRDYFKDAKNNRSRMCRELTSVLGWESKENSLQKEQNKRK